MNWDAIGAVAEVVGAIGVVITLVYLAIQIKQNTASLKSSTLQSMLEASAGLHDLCASDPELGRLFLMGIESQANLSEDELPRFHFLMMAFMRRLEAIYNQGLSGQVPESDWSGVRGSAIEVIASPGAGEWWALNRYRFSPDFKKWVSDEVDRVAA